MLHAYFDESGTDGKCLVVSIAGYVATKDVWTDIELAWRKQLAVYGINKFRMAACVAGRGEFKDINQDSRCQLIHKLADILKSKRIQGVWSAVETEAWDSVVDEAEF